MVTSEARRARVLELFVAGASKVEIARQLGISRQRVHQIIGRTGRSVMTPDERRERQRKARRACYLRRVENHRCLRCGSPAAEGKKHCVHCLEMMRQINRTRPNRTAARKLAGLCIRCGKRHAAPGRASCTPCLVMTREATRRSKAKRMPLTPQPQ